MAKGKKVAKGKKGKRKANATFMCAMGKIKGGMGRKEAFAACKKEGGAKAPAETAPVAPAKGK
jgi:hypothetical protein